jgi:hypothetical protein
VYGANVGMVERGRRSGLTFESLEGLSVTGQRVRKEFESDETAEF